MQDISFEAKNINPVLLDETIRQELGERAFGVSQTANEIVILFLINVLTILEDNFFTL